MATTMQHAFTTALTRPTTDRPNHRPTDTSGLVALYWRTRPEARTAAMREAYRTLAATNGVENRGGN